jgi:hypothetical protein
MVDLTPLIDSLLTGRFPAAAKPIDETRDDLDPDPGATQTTVAGNADAQPRAERAS